MPILSSARLAVVLAILAPAFAGCGGEDGERPPRGSEAAGVGDERKHRGEAPRAGGERPPIGADGGDSGRAGGTEGAPDDGERPGSDGAGGARPADLALVTVRRYVAALNARDGDRVCALLVRDALAGVALPRERDGCAASLDASIGYRDPRGLPVFEEAEVSSATVEVDGGAARVVATILTRFADRSQPSFEDDVIHLRRTGAGWLIAKASSVLHRAIGIADVPPSVLAPP